MKEKKCLECGRMFTPRCGTQRYCDGPHLTRCKCCDRIFYYTCSPKEKPNYCSKQCINEGKKLTVRNKYGVDNVSQLPETKDKISKANSSSEVTEKRKATCIANWGVDNVAKASEIRKKMSEVMKTDAYLRSREQTCIEKYGYSSPMLNQAVKDKREATCIEKYGMKGHPWNEDIFSKILTDSSKASAYMRFKEDPREFIISTYRGNPPSITDLMNDVGSSNTPIYDILIANNCSDLILHTYSNMEDEVTRFIENLLPGIVIERNNRTIIAPLEIDIYLPEYKIGFECNPAATHNSSIPDPWGSMPKHYKYHQDKSFAAQSVGVFLFHIFGYEWINKQDIVKSMIANLLHCNQVKMNARDCYVCELSDTECKDFLARNHRQGPTTSKIRLGLKKKTDDTLVSVMTFSKLRNTMGKTAACSDNEWELARFCSLLGHNIRGSASKLFSYFLKHFTPECVISFSDVAHTKGTLYNHLGFSKCAVTPPSYVWSDIYDNKYYHRVSCQKQYLKKLLHDDSIDTDNQTEREIMEAHKFVRIYDSGVIRWEYKC